MNTAAKEVTPEVTSAAEASGAYREMLIRLMTRQLYAETATAEVFGRSIGAAPTWREKHLAAEFALEEAQHSQILCNLLTDLGEDPEDIITNRPAAANFWSLDLDDWLHIAVFNFTVDRAGSQQIMEYRQSSYIPWSDKMEVVLADEEEHYENGVDNLREYAENPERLAEFQKVYNSMLPVTLKRAFGRPHGADNDFCLTNGLKRNSTEQVINRYLTEMKGYMEPAGLKFPAMQTFDDAGVELTDSTKDILESLQ
ncbi:MAG: phenylacetate-CoA oxygenase subunit PaaI [Gammaproteobacteria bacterium]|nr:phenylacetate-CoA oxygenase subunit PaaI [Gammaproteobacteria bacterium]